MTSGVLKPAGREPSQTSHGGDETTFPCTCLQELQARQRGCSKELGGERKPTVRAHCGVLPAHTTAQTDSHCVSRPHTQMGRWPRGVPRNQGNVSVLSPFLCNGFSQRLGLVSRKEVLEGRIWVRVQGDLLVSGRWSLYQQHWHHTGAW